MWRATKSSGSGSSTETSVKQLSSPRTSVFLSMSDSLTPKVNKQKNIFKVNTSYICYFTIRLYGESPVLRKLLFFGAGPNKSRHFVSGRQDKSCDSCLYISDGGHVISEGHVSLTPILLEGGIDLVCIYLEGKVTLALIYL